MNDIRRRIRRGPPPPARTWLLPLLPLLASFLCSSAAGLSTGYSPPTYRSRSAVFPTRLRLASSGDGDDRDGRTDKGPSSQEATRRTALQQLLLTATAPLLTSSPAAAATATATATATAAAASNALPAVPPQLRATTWPLGKVAFSLLPLAGSYTRRATVMETLVEDEKGNGIWTFDQVQGVVNVNVPVRMVVIKVYLFCFDQMTSFSCYPPVRN